MGVRTVVITAVLTAAVTSLVMFLVQIDSQWSPAPVHVGASPQEGRMLFLSNCYSPRCPLPSFVPCGGAVFFVALVFCQLI